MKNALTMAALPAMLLSAIAAPAMAAPGNNPLPDPGGVFLSYVNQPTVGGVIEKSPELGVKVWSGGAPVVYAHAVMDTGSVGIVISRDAFSSDGAGIDTGEPGSITYSSSGKTMSGTTGHASITVEGANGRSVTTEAIDFLIVDKVSCAKNARHCQATSHPTGIAMMGIGFGRQDKNGDETFTPARNPFTHVASQKDGTVRRGYVVTAEGVQVGVNPMQLTGRDFELTTLQPDPAHQDQEHPGNDDWLPQDVAIMVNGQSMQGQILIDTGVTDMYMTVPYAVSQGLTVSACEDRVKQSPAYDTQSCARIEAAAAKGDYTSWTTLQPGTDVRIGISNGQAPVGLSAAYGFQVAGTAAVAPDRLLLVRNLTPPDGDAALEPTFVNTSVRFLNGFNYLFDQQDGYTGFQLHAPGKP